MDKVEQSVHNSTNRIKWPVIMRVMLVEDEPQVASFVRQGLNEESIAVEWKSSGKDALSGILQEKFDLVILDIRLPDLSGIEVCRQIRLHDAAIPILMLTALDAVSDRVAGLRAGADDYLPKPFEFEELLARIQALIRRASLHKNASLYQDGGLKLDPVSHRCSFNEEPIQLTKKEFDLLAYFLARKNQALSRKTIHRDVWGYDFDRGTNLIDVYVGYLRRKLQEVNCPATIETARGVGYRYRSAEDFIAAPTDVEQKPAGR